METKHFVVFDSDSHVIEPLALWEKYLDPEYMEPMPESLIARMMGCNAARHFATATSPSPVE